MGLFYLTFSFLIHIVSSIDPNLWELVLTDTPYLAINSHTVWRLDSTTPPTVSGGYQMYQYSYTTQTWTFKDGLGYSLSLDSQAAYAINGAKKILRRGNNDPTWTFLNIYGNDLKVSSNDQIWYIGNDLYNTLHPYSIYKYTNGVSTVANGAAVKVAAAPDGTSWVVNSPGQVWKGDVIGYTMVTGGAKAFDIIIGSDGVPVIVSQVETEGGYEIQKWDGVNSQWVTIEGIGGIVVTLDSENNPYVVTKTFSVYRLRGIVTTYCPSNLFFYYEKLFFV